MKHAALLAASACLWGVNFYFLEAMQAEAGLLETGFWRYLLAVIILFLFSLKSLPSWRLVGNRLPGLLVVGLGCLFLFNILLFAGVSQGSAINASLIISLNPVATMIMAVMGSGSRLLPRQISGALISLAGVLYLLTRGELVNLLDLQFSIGDLLVFAAMLLSSLYHILSKKISSGFSSMQYTLLTNTVCLVGFVCSLPFTRFTRVTGHSSGFWLAALGFGALGTAVTYLMWNRGLQGMPAHKAGLFMNIVPLATALIAVLFGRRLEAFHLVSLVIILSGLSLSQLPSSAKWKLRWLGSKSANGT